MINGLTNDVFHILIIDSGFKEVCGYSFNDSDGLQLGVHYGDMPYGNRIDYKIWHKYISGKCWIVTDKLSGCAIGIGNTMQQAIEHAYHMINVFGGISEIKRLANKSIDIYGIAPGYNKNERY